MCVSCTLFNIFYTHNIHTEIFEQKRSKGRKKTTTNGKLNGTNGNQIRLKDISKTQENE